MADEPPREIDIPIPPRELDIPLPPKTVLSELVKTISGETAPDFPRLLLRFAAEGQQLSGDLSEQLDKLRQKAEGNPQQTALVCDIELGLLIKRATELNSQLKENLTKNVLDMGLALEANTVIEGIHEVQKRRPVSQPNQVTEFAQSLGVEEQIAKTDPFGALEEKLSAALRGEFQRQKIGLAIENWSSTHSKV